MPVFRQPLRALLRSPGFAVVVILTLALGMGSVTAILGVLNQTLLHKPHPHYERLTVFGSNTPHFGFISNSYPIQVMPCVAQGKCFEAFAINAWGRGTLGTGTETLGINFGRVNQDYFEVLGGKAALGRLFRPDEFQAGYENVLVLHHALWKESFEGDPGVIGRSVVLEGRSCQIVGVLSRDFTQPGAIGVGIYQPLVLVTDPAKSLRPVFMTVARLRPGLTLPQANAEVAVLGAAQNAAPRFQQRLKDQPIYLRRLSEEGGAFTQIHGAFLGAIGFLYAIACLNAINMMLVRLSARRRELGIRQALGSSRATLLRLLMTEGLVLSLLSGLLGLAVAWALMPAILNILAPPIPDYGPLVQLDGGTFLLMLGTSLLTVVLVALVPAWRIARKDPQEALKEDGASAGESWKMRRLREGLVVMGAALALVLLTGTGLMTRSVQRLMKVDRGFDPGNKVALWLDLPRPLQDPVPRHDLYQRLEARLREVPGIRQVARANTIPMAGSSSTELQKPDGTKVIVGPNPVSAGYLSSLGLRLLKGRWLPERPEGPSGVVVLNATMARLWFGSEDPIGRCIKVEDTKVWEVIGLVSDVRDHVRDVAEPQFYYPAEQDADRSSVLSLLLDLSVKPNANLLQTIRRTIHQVEPLAGVRAPVDLEGQALKQIARERFTLVILQAISTVALLLALLGLFSVMAYTVNQRMRAFGIRIALGASPQELATAILAQGLRLGGLGMLVGLGGSWALTRFLGSILYETSPLDPIVYVAMSLLLLASTALACWIPARRAAQANPADLLRTE